MGDSTILWAFLYLYHMDKANACIHCAPVRFSPITFNLFQALMDGWPQTEDIIQEMAEVRSHVGEYQADPGR
jgi:hypothetical protein